MGITCLYYTCNRIPESFAIRVRNHLLETINGEIPIISISQKPISFGENIHVSGLQPSIYNVYKQILIGAEKAKTKYVACVEDDTLYNIDHFRFIPPSDDTFYYNRNRWKINENRFSFSRIRRHPTGKGMCVCIASRELMIETLKKRFEKYPEEPKTGLAAFGEPGRYEYRIGLDVPKSDSFSTSIPVVTFNHRFSLSGARRFSASDNVQKELPYWGKAEDLWKRMWSN